MPERPDARTRRFVARRADFRCEYCRTPVGLVPCPYSAEHILPRSRGGLSVPDNLAFACQGCNGHKASKTQGYFIWMWAGGGGDPGGGILRCRGSDRRAGRVVSAPGARRGRSAQWWLVQR